ncbi:hypothetical protein CEXT_646151 [Caerostris extrusa]|uniref:Uncharacterized protein n=1 Tax=Caerostris extrusa TaxID=172846 RepID=A0AAV4XG20_CAEEX|nr:hypothetical protein CEXT_646151 [Caerostris extrusa]
MCGVRLLIWGVEKKGLREGGQPLPKEKRASMNSVAAASKAGGPKPACTQMGFYFTFLCKWVRCSLKEGYTTLESKGLLGRRPGLNCSTDFSSCCCWWW